MTTATADTTLLDAIVAALGAAGVYNRDDQAAPAAVLWTDGEQQWGPILPRLRQRLPLVTLGPYDAAQQTGPAYWLRCRIAGTLPGSAPANDGPPIVYLPGHARQDVRAVEDCPRELLPLAELQYRGVFWTHRNGKDWTVSSFLQAAEGGLGIEVNADAATREALQRALPKLVDEPLSRLRREAPLGAVFFNELLNPDPVRSVLQWLSAPEQFRTVTGEADWQAFRVTCRQRLELDPETDGPVTAALRLGRRDGAWAGAWARFAEAPSAYPGIPEQLGRARPLGMPSMLEPSESWPQDNAAAETTLRGELQHLHSQTPQAARETVRSLEERHGARRAWVWATLGRSPLARALAPLATLARETQRVPAGQDVAAIAEAYATSGWRADAAAIDALAAVESNLDVAAVKAAVRALYEQWLAGTARALQEAVARGGPGAYIAGVLPAPAAGTCVLFSDGLRYDVGCRLAGHLEAAGLQAEVGWRLTALPSVTGTAKSAVSPVAAAFAAGPGLTPASAAGTPVNVEVLRRALSAAAYQVLQGDETGDPAGRAWTEAGDIDSLGHSQGTRLAQQIDLETRRLAQRIESLLDAGWRTVTVVTDHGWLLLPGGLPKTVLPEHLTELRKGRCARLRPASQTGEQTVPWFWDSSVSIALAGDIHCYEAGKEYEHGGLSPQECVTPVITVTRLGGPGAAVAFVAVSWQGLRCVITLSGDLVGVTVDLRSRPGDAGSSLCGGPRPVRDDGTRSLPVPDDNRAGERVMVVALGADGALLAQYSTTVGGTNG